MDKKAETRVVFLKTPPKDAKGLEGQPPEVHVLAITPPDAAAIARAVNQE
jgi:hypothetical protein